MEDGAALGVGDVDITRGAPDLTMTVIMIIMIRMSDIPVSVSLPGTLDPGAGRTVLLYLQCSPSVGHASRSSPQQQHRPEDHIIQTMYVRCLLTVRV